MAKLEAVVFAALCCLCWLAMADAQCREMTVSSNNFAYKRTTVDGAIKVRSIRVIRKLSRSACQENKSFGKYGPDVWVDDGCRAKFRVCITPGNLRNVTCSSRGFERQRCNQPSVIRTLTVAKQFSNSPCVPGFSYRRRGNVLEVDKGCRAEFYVGLN